MEERSRVLEIRAGDWDPAIMRKEGCAQMLQPC